MFPHILSVPNRDKHRGCLKSLFRTVSIRGSIPRATHQNLRVGIQGFPGPTADCKWLSGRKDREVCRNWNEMYFHYMNMYRDQPSVLNDNLGRTSVMTTMCLGFESFFLL